MEFSNLSLKEKPVVNLAKISFSEGFKKCSYCKKEGSKSVGYTFPEISTEMCERLLNRGFTRCGDYYYQFLENINCCQANICRIEIDKFKPTNRQLKAARRFFREEQTEVIQEDYTRQQCVEEIKKMLETTNIAYSDKISLRFSGKGKPHFSSSIFNTLKALKLLKSKTPTEILEKANLKIAFELKKDILYLYPEMKGKTVKEVKKEEKDPISGLFTVKHTLKLPRNFSITIEKASFTEEKYSLFSKFESFSFQKETNEASFTRFLCKSGLYSHKPIKRDTLFNLKEHGAYHMLYRQGEELKMVGVIDILAETLSAGYLFYAPDMREHAPGVLATQIEVELARYLSTLLPSLQYYSQGIYVPSNPKMAMKASYQPLEILSQVDYNYHSKLDNIEPEELWTNIKLIPVKVHGKTLPFCVLRDDIIHADYKELINEAFYCFVSGIGDGLIPEFSFIAE